MLLRFYGCYVELWQQITYTGNVANFLITSVPAYKQALSSRLHSKMAIQNTINFPIEML